MNTALANLQSCTDRLAIWDRLTVSHVSGGNRESFETRIEDFDGKALYVTPPPNPQSLHFGAEADVAFLTDDGLYKFVAILDMAVIGGRQYLSLKPLTRVRHEQRRAAVRVPIHVDIDIAQIDRPIDHKIEPEDLFWESTTCVDFSSSGLLVHGTRTSMVGDLVGLRFNREQMPQAPQYGLALWRRLQKANDIMNIGLEFVTRERLGRYLMHQELQFLGPEIAQLRESHLNAFSKFVFDYELKQRQRGAW